MMRKRSSERRMPEPGAKTRRLCSAIAAAAFCLAVNVSMAQADTATTTPLADTYTRSDQPDQNFGSSVRVSAEGASPVRRAYLRFDVRLPAGSTPTKATLRIHSVSAGTSTGVELRGVADNTWGESTLTYRNAPAHGTTVSRAASYADGSWVSLDATPLVRASGLVSMALTTASDQYHGFDSRDSASDPQLVVEYAPATAPSPSPGSGHAVLHSTPSEPFVDPGGAPVKLHGFNVMPVWNNNTGATWDQSKYWQIRDKGFNAVRFVLKWSDFEPFRGTFNQTHLATLDTAIARAKAAGLYVILDAIHLYGTGGFAYVPAWAKTGDSVTTVATNGAGYLKMLAARYRNEPAVAAYDAVNEFYRWPIDQNGVLRAYDKLIREIRSVDPDKIVVIEPTFGDTSIAGALADFSNLTQRQNVVWSIHDYFAGGDDDGYAADGSKQGTYTFGGTTGYPSPNLQQLENHLLVHVNKMRQVGLPIWIGEFGIGDGVANHDRWIRDKVALFRQYGLGRAWWEYYTRGPMSAVDASFSWKPWVDLIVPGISTPPPSSDTVPPDTTITSGPAEGSTTSATSASLAFTASEAGATFECRLDASVFAPCSSPTAYSGLAGGMHTFGVRAKDAAGNVDQTPATRSWTVTTSSGGVDPVIVAAGDVACDPASSSFNGGAGTSTACRQRYTANLVEAINPTAVLMLGDAQYEEGTLTNFSRSYDPTWGRFKSKTWTTAGGSHDFYGGGDFYRYFGTRAGPAPYSGFSLDIGSWHVISLPSGSSCSNSSVGGCGVGSKWHTWLKNDLAAHSNRCTVAFWHYPLWSSGYHGNSSVMKEFMRLLYDGNADLVLAAHDHNYERFAPQTPDGVRDDTRGIPQIVVGTGGKSLRPMGTTKPNSLVRNASTYGVLKLTLRSGGYDFEFVPEPGKTFTDKGSGTCH